MLEKNKEYIDFFVDIKRQIQEARIKAGLAVNQELIKLYWNIGRQIVDRQANEPKGTNIIEKLAKDLQNAFPGIQGFSRTNIFRMRQFFLFCQKIPPVGGQLENNAIPPELLAIPWRHIISLIEQVGTSKEIMWYAQKTIEHGWSRRTLEDYIKSQIHTRYGQAITNFKSRLPSPQSQLAQETLKNPYSFDFLTLAHDFKEKELEQGLIDHVEQFLLELGEGFSLVGRQYPLKISNKTFYLDLLFYHLKLRCYCVIELKTTEFEPRDAGQLNFYLSAVDDILKHHSDNPTIGILLCKTKNKVLVEYALRDINKPIGVAEYETKILESLPENLKGSLPTVEEIEEGLEKYSKENGEV